MRALRMPSKFAYMTEDEQEYRGGYVTSASFAMAGIYATLSIVTYVLGSTGHLTKEDMNDLLSVSIPLMNIFLIVGTVSIVAPTLYLKVSDFCTTESSFISVNVSDTSSLLGYQ